MPNPSRVVNMMFKNNKGTKLKLFQQPSLQILQLNELFSLFCHYKQREREQGL